MIRLLAATALLVLWGAGPASAQALMDLEATDPAMLADFLGDWSIQNADGSKSCNVTLTREATIGGLEIDINPDCKTAFPVMDEVVAWRLYDDWQIVLVDATRKSLISFSTPDNAYVAEPETDGIKTIVKLGSGLEN